MLRFRAVVSKSKSFRAQPTRRIASAATSRNRAASPSFSVVSTCPSPTCACAATPSGLDIERKRDLHGSIAPYTQHVVISTGKTDWTSRIEDDGQGTSWGDLGRQLKALLGRGGKYSDPYNNIMITNSSFPDAEDGQGVLLFPSFRSVLLPNVSNSTVEQFIQHFLLPETLNPMHNALSALQKKTLTRVLAALGSLSPPDTAALQQPTILICGHNSRDARCGVMGPLLQSEFARKLQELDFDVSTRTASSKDERQSSPRRPAVQVGLSSHIGGHKWAGNIIVYLPPQWTKDDGKVVEAENQKPNLSALAGCGIWYGRVEPKHVEGIINETIVGGNVIKELFRGGIGPKSEVLRLPLEN